MALDVVLECRISSPRKYLSIVDPLDRGVPRAADAGFLLLGAPVGNIPFSRDVVSNRVSKIASLLDLLPSLNNAQVEFGILRFCFSFPKMSYCLRTCNPEHLLPVYSSLDSL